MAKPLVQTDIERVVTIPLVVGNWKMNLTAREASAFASGMAGVVPTGANVEVAIAPSFTSLLAAAMVLGDTPIKVSAQDVFWMTKGAFTGQISAEMLADLGVEYCIVGHSETRGRFGKLEVDPSTLPYFSEMDETISLKITALNDAGIVPILCVGETQAERESGKTHEIISGQLKGALSKLAHDVDLVVAYEPVWAIGTGQTCDAEEANKVCALIRLAIQQLARPKSLRVLYGGSVKASNAGELFAEQFIDGGLVGGASLDISEFREIVKSAL